MPEDNAAARDLIEAMRILQRKTIRMPELRHLQAVAMDAAVARQRVVHMGQILSAILHDSGKDEHGVVWDHERGTLTISADLFREIRELKVSVGISDEPEGVVLQKIVPEVPVAADGVH